MKEKNPIPQGKYIPATRFNNIIFTAGMTPRKNGILMFEGKIKACNNFDKYKEAVELATSNALTAAINCMNENEYLNKILHITVYINSDDHFYQHSEIGDLASEFLISKYGKSAIAARTTIGVQSLPSNAPIEVQLIVAVGNK